MGGVGNGVQWVAVMSTVQELTEDRFQARVAGLLESIAVAMPGVGFILGGVITEVLDPRAGFAVAGGGVLAVLLLAMPLLRGAEWTAAPAKADAPPPARRPSRPTSEPTGARRADAKAPSTAAAAADMVGSWEASRSDHRSGCCHGRSAAFPRWAPGTPGLPWRWRRRARGARAGVRLPGTRRRDWDREAVLVVLLLFSFYAYVGAAHLRDTASLDAAFVAALLGVVLLGPLAGALVFAAPELTRLASDRRLTSMLANLASFGWASPGGGVDARGARLRVAGRARLARLLRRGRDRRPRADPRELLLHHHHLGRRSRTASASGS